MNETIVVGVERASGEPYRLVLPEKGPVTPPAELESVWPEPGTELFPGAVGGAVVFDPADPGSVMTWLRTETDVVAIQGPDPTPYAPGDVTDWANDSSEGDQQ